MERIRFAIIGAGSVVHLYLPCFRQLEGAELVALADPNVERARSLAARYGVPKVYADARAAAEDRDIDAAVIATPSFLHAEHAELFAAAGKHVLCEKPMASTLDGCRRIIEACRKAGVRLQVAHMKRFMRGNQMVRRLIDRGALGRLFMVDCRWDIAVPLQDSSYRNQEATGGGLVQEHGPHAFDLVRWWTRSDIRAVSAAVRLVNPEAVNEDTAAIVAEHDRGIVSVYHMSRVSYGREHLFDDYRVYGTNGTLVVRNDHHFPTTSLELPRITLHVPGDAEVRIEPAHPHSWNADDAARQNSPFFNELRAFCECIAEGTEPRVSGEDGLASIEPVIASYVSTLSGRKVELSNLEDIDLMTCFRELRRRDRAALGADYRVAEPPVRLPEPTLLPVYAHRPPRTGESWSDDDHGFAATPLGW